MLHEWTRGDERALEQLIPLVHHELIRIARRQVAGETRHRRLQATELVNEAYLRLIEARRVSWQDRAHFLAICARIMRQILVDEARARRAKKRGGAQTPLTLDDALTVGDSTRHDIVALDEALEALARLDERKSRVIELRFFGGLTVEETATVVKVSPDTVMRDWRLARAWLRREMNAGAAGKA